MKPFRQWPKDRTIAAITGLAALIGSRAAVFVVPESRRVIGLDPAIQIPAPIVNGPLYAKSDKSRPPQNSARIVLPEIEAVSKRILTHR